MVIAYLISKSAVQHMKYFIYHVHITAGFKLNLKNAVQSSVLSTRAASVSSRDEIWLSAYANSGIISLPCGYGENIGSIIELYIFLLIYFLNHRENTAIGLKKKPKAPKSELSDALDESKVPNGIVYVYVIGLLSMIIKEVIIKRYKSVIKDSGLQTVLLSLCIMIFHSVPLFSWLIVCDSRFQ